ncbi:MAG: diguanylate cyclase response regulator [Oscillospiraceae bacterium]|nr:diguanylate cyclase response regulator [Oscillospiraceae bacterium]
MSSCSTILIADDMELNRCLLKNVFETEYKIIEAADGQEALDILRQRDDICLLLLDLIMPKKGGYAVLQEMVNEGISDKTPVIVVTASSRISDEIQALEMGASDIIILPFHPQVLKQRAQNVINAQARFKKVTLQKEKYKQRAQKDLLTGLYNKVSVQSLIEEKLKDYPNVVHTLFVIDLDNFKRINDTCGHAVGDQALQAFSRLLSQVFEEADLVGRIGGDEFVALVSNVIGESSVTAKASQIIARFAQHSFTEQFPTITSSIGMAMYPQDGQTYEALYCNADKALYSAKKSGKNGYVMFGQSIPKMALNRVKNPEALIDAMEDAVYVTDVATYEMIYANKAIDDMVGYTIRGKGEKCYKILHGLDAPCEWCDVTKLSLNHFYARICNVHSGNDTFNCLVRGKLINWNGTLAHMEVASTFDKLLPKDKAINI